MIKTNGMSSVISVLTLRTHQPPMSCAGTSFFSEDSMQNCISGNHNCISSVLLLGSLAQLLLLSSRLEFVTQTARAEYEHPHTFQVQAHSAWPLGVFVSEHSSN